MIDHMLPKALALAVSLGTPRLEPRRVPVTQNPMTGECLAFNLYLAPVLSVDMPDPNAALHIAALMRRNGKPRLRAFAVADYLNQGAHP